jgi:hypothetical protein
MLRKLFDEEEALKRQIKERGEDAVALGYERRSSLVSEQAPKCSAARRDSIHNCREARRASAPNVSGTESHIDSLIKPTVNYQVRAAEKRQSSAPVKQEKQQLTPEELEEQRQKLKEFHSRNSAFQQTKQRFLDTQRQKREEQEMVGCTFKPVQRVASTTSATFPETMLERAQRAQAKKEAKLRKLRQEQFDKEMAQCSFRPVIHDPWTAERCPNTTDSRRSSFSSCNSVSSSRGYSAARYAPPRSRSLGVSAGYAARHAVPYEASEASEYWSGSQDEAVSLGSVDHQDSFDDEMTILPSSTNGTLESAGIGGVPHRPPRMPGNTATPFDAAQAAFNERALEQLQSLQRMQERRQLLEETMTPTMTPQVTSFESPSAASFEVPPSGVACFAAAVRRASCPGITDASPGVASFAAAIRRNSCQDTTDSRRGSAAVAEAVGRMEELLGDDLTIDLEDEWELDHDMMLDTRSVDEEDDISAAGEDIEPDQDNLGGSPGEPLLKSNIIRQRQPSSPICGGA